MVLSCTLFLLFHHCGNNRSEAPPLMAFCYSTLWCAKDGMNRVSVCQALSLPSIFSSSGLIAIINLYYERPDACLKSVQWVLDVYHQAWDCPQQGPEYPHWCRHWRRFDGCSHSVLSNFTRCVEIQWHLNGVCGCVSLMQFFCKGNCALQF